MERSIFHRGDFSSAPALSLQRQPAPDRRTLQVPGQFRSSTPTPDRRASLQLTLPPSSLDLPATSCASARLARQQVHLIPAAVAGGELAESIDAARTRIRTGTPQRAGAMGTGWNAAALTTARR